MRKIQRKIILCIDDNLEVLKSLRFQLRHDLMKDVRILLAEGSEEANSRRRKGTAPAPPRVCARRGKAEPPKEENEITLIFRPRLLALVASCPSQLSLFKLPSNHPQLHHRTSKAVTTAIPPAVISLGGFLITE